MQKQINYARQAGHYEGTIRGLATTLEWLAENPHLSHNELVTLVKEVSLTMKEALDEAKGDNFLL